MERTEITTIIFDLGGVFFDWDPRHLYRKVFEDPREMEFFLHEICNHDWNVKQDAGRPFEEAIQEATSRYPKYHEEIRMFIDRWPEMLNGVYEGTLNIFERIKARNYRLYALTNWSAETWKYTYQNYTFLHDFEDILVSGQEKMRKPFPEIYELILKRFKINGQRAIFIDDSMANVEGARKAGIHAIHFEDPGKLELDLQNFGLDF